MRSVGLLAVMLAHNGKVPDYIMQLRNFDVILMVMVMAISYTLSDNGFIGYQGYLKKRFMRLIVPAWKFMTLFFAVNYIAPAALKCAEYTWSDYLDSYIFSSGLPNHGGIGYVWILRNFLLVSFALPIEKNIMKSLKHKSNLFVFLLLLVANEIIVDAFSYAGVQSIVVEIFIYGFSYCVVAYYGLIVYRLDRKELVIHSALWGIVYILLCVRYKFVNTQVVKYPPRLYYLSYAFFVCIILYILANTHFGKKLGEIRMVRWISQNSYWIYLWHIAVMWIFEVTIFRETEISWLIRYVTIVISSFVTTVLFNRIRITLKRC